MEGGEGRGVLGRERCRVREGGGGSTNSEDVARRKKRK